NSFFFDEPNKNIYIGFKNINRVVKIGYPGGEVKDTYGKSLKPGGSGEDMFCYQHSVGLTMDGLFYFFNNNSCRPGLAPSVIMAREPAIKGGRMTKVWEYDCVGNDKFHEYFVRGG